MKLILEFLTKNSLPTGILYVGAVYLLAKGAAKHLLKQPACGSAMAVLSGLLLSLFCGMATHKASGIADLAVFSGVGVLGCATLRDISVVAVSYGSDIRAIMKYKWAGLAALSGGVCLSFVSALLLALGFGIRDPRELTVIASGAVTFIVGPVTASALGVTSGAVALSIAIGVLKSIAIMLLTPWAARAIGLKTPKSAMIYGALLGSTSGVSAGLAAVDPDLVPYGAMMASFYMGLGCLLCPTLFYSLVCCIV